MKPLRLTLVLALLALMAGGTPAWASGIRARVYFTGKAPRMGLLKRNEGACGGNKFATDEYVVVDPTTGAMKNVLVWISRGAAAPSVPKDAEMQSQACMFRPRLAAFTPGGVVRITTADNLPHLWHAFQNVKTVGLQKAEPGAAPAVFEPKLAPGQFVRIKDDTRPWMDGFAVVVDSAFYGVTSDKGETSLLELPGGQYTVTSWHERYGLKMQEVTVPAEGLADVRFLYDGTEVRP